MKMLKSLNIWGEFQAKLKNDTFTVSDFTTEMCQYLQPLLCGEYSAARRQKFLDSPFDMYEKMGKISVISHCADDDYCFDLCVMVIYGSLHLLNVLHSRFLT